jgi:hypothetical protein
MAITRRLQARTTVTAAVHSQLVTGHAKLRVKKIEILDQTPNADGTVTVVFCGQGLGKSAIPTPPPCAVTIVNGEINIQPIE